jgi:allantoicase
MSAVTHLRLDVYPDGGLSRLRLFGELDADALAKAHRQWWDSLPADHQAVISDQAPR